MTAPVRPNAGCARATLRGAGPGERALRGAVARPSLVCLVVLSVLLGGCAIVPGNDVYGMRQSGQSQVPLPVEKDGEQVPEHIKLTPITAELIIAKEKELSAVPQQIYKPTKHEDYRLGPGDIVNVIVWDHPELTIPAGEFRSAEASGTVVSEDGTIFFPYAGVVKVAGHTLRETRNILTEKLSKTIENVQLEVRVAAFRSQRVYVVGEVARPGIVDITDIPMTMTEAINRAGGLSAEADSRHIALERDGTTLRVDLQSLYEDGDLSQNLKLRHGDIVNVPDRKQNKVFVLGEVGRQGSQIMNKRRLTLAEALADAGYINQATANPNQIYVMRGGKQPEIYHLASKSPDATLLADRFPLLPRDVVYVDAASIVRWNKLVSNLLPSQTLLNNQQNLTGDF